MMFINEDPVYQQLYPFNNLPNAEMLCYNVMNYLLDLPKGDYQPTDSGARADLIRLLFYDDVDALNRNVHPLPSAEQKRSLLYNPNDQTPSLETASKGYRLFLQPRVIEAQTDQKSELRIFPGATEPTSDFVAKQCVEFQILVGMSIDQIAGGMSRAYNILLSIIRALNGVDIGSGINVLHFNRAFHRSCGTDYFTDGRFNCGYYLTMATEFGTNQ